MTQDNFHKGLATIETSLQAALTERGVQGAETHHDFEGSEPKAVTFTVTVGGKSQVQTFSREEIDDSAEAIDAPSAVKIRMLTGPFVR